jgi:hypothetical protein
VPEAELEAAEGYRKQLALSEGRRLAAARDLRELERRPALRRARLDARGALRAPRPA